MLLHNKAVLAFQAGNYRKAADVYADSFRACPGVWAPHRFHIFDAYTSILDENYFTSTDADLERLNRVLKDKSEPALYRVHAASSMAQVMYGWHERHETAKRYRDVIRIAGKASAKERRTKVDANSPPVTRNGVVVPGPFGPRFVGDLIDETLKHAEGNLSRLGVFSHEPLPAEMRSNGTTAPANSIGTKVAPGTELSEEKLKWLVSVGGETCDRCGKSRGGLGMASLKACSRCRKMYYCGPECQRSAWKETHKTHCRAPGELKAGDYVRLKGSVGNPALNGLVVPLIQPVAEKVGRWEVRVRADAVVSIAAEKMEQLRPLPVPGSVNE